MKIKQSDYFRKAIIEDTTNKCYNNYKNDIK